VVIDCTPSDVGLQNKKQIYEKHAHNTLGFIAQGSEFGFRQDVRARHFRSDPEAWRRPSTSRWSPATPQPRGADRPDRAQGGLRHLEEARFLCIRRANDISQDTSFVPSPQVNRHKDERFGTHHARDAWHLFKQNGYD